jgi:hypothetical protein
MGSEDERLLNTSMGFGSVRKDFAEKLLGNDFGPSLEDLFISKDYQGLRDSLNFLG